MITSNNNDEKLIEEKYNSFLQSIKQMIKKTKIENPLEIYRIICNMFRNGEFSINKSIDFTNDFDYLTLPNIKYAGAQIMYGVCSCRHASSFINDVLNMLGYNSSLYYIYIDEKDGWYISNPNEANHMVVLLNNEYILDPTNNFILKKEPDNRLVSLNTKPEVEISECDKSLYNNIDEIGGILKKYYFYKNFGIKHKF